MENTLAHDLKLQAESMIDAAKSRVDELDKLIRELSALEAERSSLLQQINLLEKLIGVEPRKPVPYRTERTRKGRRYNTVTDDMTIADIAFELLEEVYPEYMHWTAIYKRLQEYGVGLNWKEPSASIRSSLIRDNRLQAIPRGYWTLKKEEVVADPPKLFDQEREAKVS